MTAHLIILAATVLKLYRMPHLFQQSQIPLGAAGASASHVTAMRDVPPV